MKNREKEINYLIYLKSKLIQDTKKEIKQLKLKKERLYRWWCWQFDLQTSIPLSLCRWYSNRGAYIYLFGSRYS